MTLRAVQPLNPEAVAAADRLILPLTGGRKLTMDPGDAELRKKWLEAYRDAGGQVEEVKPRNKKAKKCVQNCNKKITVTGKIATVTFRSDHLDTNGNKLLKKSKPVSVRITQFKADGTVQTDALGNPVTRDYLSEYADEYEDFVKPEWDIDRGGASDSHPVSHTGGRKVTVDIAIDFIVTPDGAQATMEKVRGAATGRTGGTGYLNFAVDHTATFGTQRVLVTGLVNSWELWKAVHYIEEAIAWTATVNGEEIALGNSGKHRVYVTLDTPGGRLASPRDNQFDESGDDQTVTAARLEAGVLAAWGTGETDEREAVDEIFEALRKAGIGYFLGTRWEHDPKDHTYVSPKPSLHHYLWLCNVAEALGECHNIAAAFALYCRIVGVKKSFSIGYMYPWPGRVDTTPCGRDTSKSAGGKNILGKLNIRKIRTHATHGSMPRDESLVFLDGRNKANNFEGVAVYDTKGLYAIGDDIFDRFAVPHDNASEYYGKRTLRPSGSAGSYRSAPSDLDKGLFKLAFSSNFGHCDDPYEGQTTKEFKWED